MEAQRGKVTCLRSHSQWVAWLDMALLCLIPVLSPAHTALCSPGTPPPPWGFLGRYPHLLQQLQKGRSCAVHAECLRPSPGRPVAGLPVVSLWAGGSKKQTLGLAVCVLRSKTKPGSRPTQPPSGPAHTESQVPSPQQACGRPFLLRAGAGRAPTP